MRTGAFRADLYYRLGVLPVRIPALRERLDDVPLLADHFIDSFNQRARARGARTAASSAAPLRGYGWPGNIRELRNLIERAMLLQSEELLAPEQFLPAESLAPRRFELPAEGINLEELELDLVTQALERTGGNRTRAAELLGLTRHQIHYRLQKLRLDDGVVDSAVH